MGSFRSSERIAAGIRYVTPVALLLAISLGFYNLLGPGASSVLFLGSMAAASFGAIGVLVMLRAERGSRLSYSRPQPSEG